MNFFQRILHRPFFIRLLHWEYWSFNSIYFPILIVWVWLAIRARSFFFFSASNPSIFNGGFLMESKKAIYDILPEGTYPKTIYVTRGTDSDTLHTLIRQHGLHFPLIAKPDLGGKGRGVKKIRTCQEVAEYAQASKLDFLIQEYVPYEQEAGIFYYRYPGKKGKISGIVRKEFLSVTGDGYATIAQLCSREKRFILQLPQLEKLYGEGLNEVLAKGEIRELVPYGNHARGAKFTDDSHLVDEAFEQMFDNLCRQVPGFYFGRLDIRFSNWEDFRAGKNFSIIELNGAGSEPTHIYDPSHSLFFAWKEIIKHWIILWKISRINHRNGIPYLTVKEGLHMLRENKKTDKILADQHV
jgi:hypothetical protein